MERFYLTANREVHKWSKAQHDAVESLNSCQVSLVCIQAFGGKTTLLCGLVTTLMEVCTKPISILLLSCNLRSAKVKIQKIRSMSDARIKTLNSQRIETEYVRVLSTMHNDPRVQHMQVDLILVDEWEHVSEYCRTLLTFHTCKMLLLRRSLTQEEGRCQ